MHKVYSLVMCQSPGWRMTSTSVATVFSWSPAVGFPHIPKSVLEGQLLYEAQKTHPCLLTIHLWKLYPFHQPEPSLPTFEEVCHFNQPTLRFIPSRSRPAFAQALSSALRCVIQENSEDAWFKVFMLPKCHMGAARDGMTSLSSGCFVQHVDRQ